MPRVATGSVYEKAGAWYGRLTLDQRVHVPLLTCKTEAEAEARKDALAEMAKDLRAAGHGGELGERLLKRAGEAADGKQLDTVREAVRRLVAGAYVGPATVKTASTFQDVADLWTSGSLARRFPDHVKSKRSADSDVHRLKHILPVVGEVEIAAFELEHADRVMALLPPMEVASRRHVAQVIHRVLALSVFPLKLRTSNPIPEGWLPKLGPKKAKAFIYPDEEERLLACGKVDLWWRLLYGFLHREGCRRGEALSLQWRDLDLRRGGITLDKNKTDDPRAWALRPDTVEALCAWWLLQGQPSSDAFVFTDDAGHVLSADHTADRYRAHLEAAGIDRPQLFEVSKARRRVTFHATRTVFVTIALANNKTETWITDRTGHKSSDQIANYRQAARTVAELNLGDLAPLNLAIPELRFFPGREAFRPEKKANEKATQTGNGLNTSTMLRIQVPAGSLPWGFKSPPSHEKPGQAAVGSTSVGDSFALSDATFALSGTARDLQHLTRGWDTLDGFVLSLEEGADNDPEGDARRAGGAS
jgi:integrase